MSANITAIIKNLAGMRVVVKRRDRPRFPLEPPLARSLQTFDRNQTVEPCFARFPHFSHSARAERRKNFIRPELFAGGEGHRLQFIRSWGGPPVGASVVR